jgi:AraC-like DNA-binding protein
VPERRFALLFGDRVAQARLAEAVRGHGSIWATEHPEEVAAAAASSPALAATVILFSPARHAEALRAAETIRAAAPDHAIIGYVDPRTLSSRFILETGRAALSDLVLRDVDDSRAVLLRVLENAGQHDSALRVAEQMCHGQPRDVRIVVQFICAHLREPLDASTIAAGLGLNRRTMYHRLGAVGSPGPRELVGWCRVLFVAHQLSQADASLSTIATQLDMPSWRSLTYLIRRYLGIGTNRLRRLDAFAFALARFREQFSESTRAADAEPSPQGRPSLVR